jgi:hypothetical protein
LIEAASPSLALGRYIQPQDVLVSIIAQKLVKDAAEIGILALDVVGLRRGERD